MKALLKFGLVFCFSLVVVLITEEARIYNAQTRRPPRTITSQTDVINAFRFSRDGRVLAIARGTRDENRVELWDTQTGSLLRAIRGFDGQVWSVSFSPDGRTLVTGSSGLHQEKVAQKPSAHNGRPFTELKWWDTQTGELKQRLESPDEDLISLAAVHSPDGRLLATIENRLSPLVASTFDTYGVQETFPSSRRPSFRRAALYDADLKILDANTGELRTKIKDGFGSYEMPFYPGAEAVAGMVSNRWGHPILFSPDGQLVASWSPNEIRLWSSISGEEKLKLKRFKGRAVAIAFSTDGRLLAGAITRVASRDNPPEFKSEIRIWEVATGAPKQVIPVGTHMVSSVAFAPNGQQLLVSGLQREDSRSYARMELVDLQSGSLGSLLAKDEGEVSSIALSPDGSLMAFQTDAGAIKLVSTADWSVKYTLGETDDAASNGASLRRFLVTVKSVSAVSFLNDGHSVVGEIEAGGIKFWDSRTGEVKKVIAQEAETGSLAQASAGGGTIAEVASNGAAVRLWNLETGAPRQLPATESHVSAIGFSGDSKTLAIAYGQRIKILNAVTLNINRTIESQAKILAVALSFNGQVLAAATADGQLNMWSVEDGSLQQSQTIGSEVTAVSFSPNDRVLAIGTREGRVGFLDRDNREVVFESKRHNAIVNAVAFSRDGRLLASGSDDRSAIVWEVATRKPLRTYKGHDLTVTSLAFSPDATILAVGSGNASVVLWEAASGRLNRVLK